MNKTCTNCGMEIKVMAFIGSPWCSDQCRKDGGADVPSVGTYMFVSVEEKRALTEARNGR